MRNSSNTKPSIVSIGLLSMLFIRMKLYGFGSSQLFPWAANLTDHGNPIINISDGFIYDAGILPSEGLRWRFRS